MILFLFLFFLSFQYYSKTLYGSLGKTSRLLKEPKSQFHYTLSYAYQKGVGGNKSTIGRPSEERREKNVELTIP